MMFDPGLSVQVTVPGYTGADNLYESDPHNPGTSEIIAPNAASGSLHGIEVLGRYPSAGPPSPPWGPALLLPANGEIGNLIAADGITVLGPLYFYAVGPPTAYAQLVTAAENTATVVTLAGSDTNSPPLPLTYSVTVDPQHGELSGTAPNLTYTPDHGYTGQDSFQFEVNNGVVESAPASVSIDVVGPAMPVYTITDTGEGVILSPALESLVFQSGPLGIPASSYGEVIDLDPGLSLHVTVPGYTGAEGAFTLYESDPYKPGAFDIIAPSVVWFGPGTYINGIGNGPHGQGIEVFAAFPSTVWLGSPALLLPANGEIGNFFAADGTLLGPLYFYAVGPPTAYAQLVTAAENTATVVTLAGSDANSPPLPLTYSFTVDPQHGELSGSPPNLTYTPDPCYTGLDSFQFIVSNGSQNSAPATVSITVTFAGQAVSQAVAVSENTATPVSLAGADADSLALTYEVTAKPSQGTLSGTAPNLAYTPGTGYVGPDSFQFKVNNSFSGSSVATVSINVVGTGENLVAAESVAAGERGSVTVPPGSGQGGVTATLNNLCGSQSVTVTAQTYSGDPEPGNFGGIATTYLDLGVSGATANDSMTSHFYYPSSVSNPTLQYYTGAAWEPVLSSGGQSPVVEQSPNLDGTVSGGRLTVVFDGTSTPALAALSGTVFALVPAPPVPGAMALGATENQSVSLPAAKLVAIATSPNGGALSITDVSATSAQGGSVSLGGGLVTYTPPAGFVG